MKPSTVLTKAKKLIEKGWCKGPMAKNARGEAVGPRSKAACQWCSFGAILAVDYGVGRLGAEDYLSRACGRSFILFNESQTSKRPVLRAFDRAIALAKSEGK